MRSISIGGDEMGSELGLGYKLVVYEDQYCTYVAKEITGFDNAEQAREHQNDYPYTRVQIDYDNYLDGHVANSDDMRSENVNDGSEETSRQVIEYYPDWVSALKNIGFYATLAVLTLGALGSLVMLLTLGAGG